MRRSRNKAEGCKCLKGTAQAGQLASHVVRAGGHILFWTCITCTAQAATLWVAAMLSEPQKKALNLSRQ